MTTGLKPGVNEKDIRTDVSNAVRDNLPYSRPKSAAVWNDSQRF